ncbi:hypothetical protein PAXRUDRAFT_823732 [Paxillus rubicundulus Ve08.2h10]|uniref:Unplaced genomic scaffold scaffold_66, whole genome shotgun sequence n=1 Tax=Paxillus rubicundulus Ve08.2h10 TaxID=930991 RepID=A0A0D0EC12_9AGAM|nr:hypothetical protein PAXRUDRAFT_823732 [Paxillus rubicundulus Ve08.2h10]
MDKFGKNLTAWSTCLVSNSGTSGGQTMKGHLVGLANGPLRALAEPLYVYIRELVGIDHQRTTWNTQSCTHWGRHVDSRTEEHVLSAECKATVQPRDVFPNGHLS